MSEPDLSKIAAVAAQEQLKEGTLEDVTDMIALVSDEGQAEQLYIAVLRRRIEDLQSLNAQRKTYAKCLFWLICSWLFGVFVILILVGFGGHWYGIKVEWFKLSDTVLVTYLATTTLNVLGLFIIVANWLFPRSGNNGKNEKTKKNEAVAKGSKLD